MEDKIYFNPGDVVQLKQNLLNKPLMIVVKKETKTFKLDTEKVETFRGIRCRWFTTNGELQEAI